MRATFARRVGRAAAAVVLAGTVVAGSSMLTAVPAAAHGACRSPEGRVEALVASSRVRCGTAQRVAAAFDAAVLQAGSFPAGGQIEARGFTCRAAGVGHEAEESFSVRCTSSRNLVRFTWGV